MRKFIVTFSLGGKDTADDEDWHCDMAIPADTERQALAFFSMSGHKNDVISVKDVTDSLPISIDAVSDALEKAKFGRHEQYLILRTLLTTKIAE